MIATLHFIKQHQFDAPLKLAGILLKDSHYLIHKAVGWMPREVGKQNLKAEQALFDKHYKQMPRTMLHYAIEKFPEEMRQDYLKDRRCAPGVPANVISLLKP